MLSLEDYTEPRKTSFVNKASLTISILYKNAKTIVFASVIVAMILPFSGMNYA